MYQSMFGNVPGWIAHALAPTVELPSDVIVSDIASGVGPDLQSALLPAGAAFTPMGGGYGALVDTDSLLGGGVSAPPEGFSHVATGSMPDLPPTMIQPPAPVGDVSGEGGGPNLLEALVGKSVGGRVGYQSGGVVDPSHQMPTGASQAGLGAPPGMMPQGMPMAAPAAPVGLGMPMGGMMPPMGMGVPMPMGGAPGGPMPVLPPPGGMQPPMPPPGQPQGGLNQPIRIPPRKAPYGRKVLEKQLEMEAEGLAKRREGFQSGGVVDGVYDPVNDVWTVPQNTPETQSSGIGDTLSSMWDRARAGRYSWLSEPLIAAGAAMMASRSPHIGPAIGEGALMGVRTHQERRKAEELERRAREQLEIQRAQLAETQKMNALRAAEAELRLEEMRDPHLPYERRAQVLERFGLDPNSKEGQAFILTGKLPDSLTGEAKVGLNPIYAKDAQGNTVLLQPTTTGEAVLTRLPEGVTISTGVDRIDLGTHWGLVDKKSGDIVGTLPKDIEGAEAAKGRGRNLAEIEKNRPVAERALREAESGWEIVEATIDKTLDDLSGMTTGWSGVVLSQIPGTVAYDVARRLETIRANIGFDKLQAMRDASPTGGALGQVSEFENRLLQAVRGSLDQGQSLEELKANLEQIKRDLRALRAERRRAYQQTFGVTEQQPEARQSSGWSIQRVD